MITGRPAFPYSGHEGVIAIGTHTLLAGNLPPRALALVIEWAAQHTDELLADWELAEARLPLAPIAPIG